MIFPVREGYAKEYESLMKTFWVGDMTITKHPIICPTQFKGKGSDMILLGKNTERLHSWDTI